MMNKYIGVDYGTKKIGLAISDDEGSIAFPECIIINSPEAHTQIMNIAQEKGVQDIVIGHSKDLDGTDNPLMKDINLFKDELEKNNFAVYLEPEFMTTFQAKRMSDDSVADASAAAIILQSFLDSTANKN